MIHFTAKQNASQAKKSSQANWSKGEDGMQPVESMSDKEIFSERIKIWKNVIIISFSFMCLFTAFNSMANLQVRDTLTPFNGAIFCH